LRIDFRKYGRIALFALPLTLIFAIACGGETVTVVETVLVEKEVEVEVIKEVEVEVQVAVIKEVEVEVEVAPERTDSRYGGELKVALGAAISTLDVHRTTGTTAYDPSFAVQERMMAYNSDLQATPLLVDTWEVSADGMQWNFTLRDGINFHNGVPFNAEHAVKSWERWAERDNYGSLIFGFIDDISVTGDLTFSIDMVEPTALVLEALARIGGYAPVMMPPEMYDVAAAEGADVLIGTGPYELVEWATGDHLLVKRYEDYSPADSVASFMAGRKDAFFDTVDYVVIPDANARIAALEVGQIDLLGRDVPADMVDTLTANPDVRIAVATTSPAREGAWIDNIEGPFTDARVRRAFAMAYPVEDALIAGHGDNRFYTLCPSMMACAGKWGGWADGSEGVYNYHDKGGLEAAQQTIKDLGLVGTDITVLQAGDRARFSGPAEISRQTLKKMGFNVIFKQTDWATQTNWREKPELWDVFHTAGGGAWAANPLLNSSLAKNKYWNKYQDESGAMTAGMEALARASSAAEQLALVKEMQNVFWQDVPYISFGDSFGVGAVRADVQGAQSLYSMSWNVYNAWRSN